jgi:hypothetical protein
MPPSAPLLASPPDAVDPPRLRELLLQALEAQAGHVAVLSASLRCIVIDVELRRDWRPQLERARRRERILASVLEQLDLDPRSQTPGRRIVARLSAALLAALGQAMHEGDAANAQVVAAEGVEIAALRAQRAWELIGHVAGKLADETGRTLDVAFESAAFDEGEGYRNRGWSRELWIESLGFRAILPPPGRPPRLADAEVPRLPWRSRERLHP